MLALSSPQRAGVCSLVLWLLAGCTADPDVCRFEPERCVDGEAGAFCTSDRDCVGMCCTDKSNCAAGMCTFSCNDDRDCPPDMACEHDVCFFRCSADADCAVGQRCEHGHTVCEWP